MSTKINVRARLGINSGRSESRKFPNTGANKQTAAADEPGISLGVGSGFGVPPPG